MRHSALAETGLYLMSESVPTTVQCQDPGDGSGDVIIDLPSALLESMNLDLGDSLSIELVDGVIVLTPIRDGHVHSAHQIYLDGLQKLIYEKYRPAFDEVSAVVRVRVSSGGHFEMVARERVSFSTNGGALLHAI